MGRMLGNFPLADVTKLRWPSALINWMQELHRAVSGDYNVIHLAKSSDTEDIGGVAGTEALIAWDSELTKRPGFEHSTTINNERVIVENTGRYSVGVNLVGYNATANAFSVIVYPKVNGSVEVYRGASISNAPSGAYFINPQLAMEIDLVGGDYVEIETNVLASSGQAVNTWQPWCEFILRRIA